MGVQPTNLSFESLGAAPPPHDHIKALAEIASTEATQTFEYEEP